MLLLSGRAVESLIDLDGCIQAVRLAFAAAGAGGSYGGFRRHVGVEGGAFHVAGGAIRLEGTSLAGFKINGRIRGDVSGVMLLSDVGTGKPLALLDSPALTAVRTAAFAVVAAEAVGSGTPAPALVVGAGRIGEAVAHALCQLETVSDLAIYARDSSRSRQLAEVLRPVSGAVARIATDLDAAARAARLIVTATSASSPLIWRTAVRPGTTVVALGADGPGKQELDPQLLANAVVVVDDLEHCAAYGELAHVLSSGVLTPNGAPATLGEIVTGDRLGRTTADEVVVVDSTGTAIADVAVASWIIAAAAEQQVGLEVDLA